MDQLNAYEEDDDTVYVVNNNNNNDDDIEINAHNYNNTIDSYTTTTKTEIVEDKDTSIVESREIHVSVDASIGDISTTSINENIVVVVVVVVVKGS